MIPLRLVSENDVAEIICKYENRAIQKTMIYELTKLNGCLATEEQFLEILGNRELEMEDWPKKGLSGKMGIVPRRNRW